MAASGLWRPDGLLRAYGYVELMIGASALAVSLLLPQLDRVSAVISSYSREASGWYALSTTSYLARAGIAVALLTPVTILMGGTLTLLIRHLVRQDVDRERRRIAVVYGVNTAGAACGAFLTDFALVPSLGLRGAQFIAVALNLLIGISAVWIARRAEQRFRRAAGQEISQKVRLKPDATYAGPGRGKKRRKSGGGAHLPAQPGPATPRGISHGQADGDAASVRSVHLQADRDAASVPSVRLQADRVAPDAGHRSRDDQSDHHAALALIGVALGMIGFAAMGTEILWFRHLTILLGQWRAVLSLLLTVILLGTGLGSLLAGSLLRRSGSSSASAANTLMVVQGLFVACTLLGLAVADAARVGDIVRSDPLYQAFAGREVDTALVVPVGLRRTFTELWFNLRPILLEVGLPSLLMGFAFPLGNAIIQRAQLVVGRRAGILYLCNTAGAVGGSLAAGFLLLPHFGIQSSAVLLTIVAAGAIGPVYFVSRELETTATSPAGRPFRVRRAAAFAVSALVSAASIGWWFLLPADYVLRRALAPSNGLERLLTVREGVTEVVAITDVPGKGKRLLTNGHPMSSTTMFAQRYMRALAHIPLLAIDRPEAALVVGFGVGNSTHAATLHPTIRRVDVADLSRDILASAGYFRDVNRDVLADPRVHVYVNDGRHHLQMQPAAAYDLITLEPPPIGYAGVAALYSTEFYALARTRLKPMGYVSQWLPAYQVPGATTLAMIRAFVDVFPHAVLVSGAEADLLLLGTNDSRIEIDPSRLAAALARAPAVQADLRRLDLGSVREIVGSFVGSSQRLAEATRESVPVSDDRPIQEYGVSSLLNLGEAVPGSIVDLSGCASWCPACFVDGQPAPIAEGLDVYLALLGRAYGASHADVVRARALAEQRHRVIAGSTYLGAIVPESADVHNLLGIALATKGRIDEAISEFREALRLEPESAVTCWHLGAALASRGSHKEAIEYLRRSVRLDPNNPQAREDLESVLALDDGR